jgi:hypothetical protein
MNDVTRILTAVERGDRAASGKLRPLVHDELRKFAAQRLAQEKPGQTLQATALLHEACPSGGRGQRAAVEQPWQPAGISPYLP